MTEAGAVELWRSGDGLWRYRYVRPDGGRAIRSNRAFPSRQEALDSIRIAYPGVPASEIEEPAGRNRGGRGWGRRVGRTAIAAGLSVHLLDLVVSLSLAALGWALLALPRRRWQPD